MIWKCPFVPALYCIHYVMTMNSVKKPQTVGVVGVLGWLLFDQFCKTVYELL